MIDVYINFNMQLNTEYFYILKINRINKKMLDDERIEDEDLLLSSPRILVSNVDDDEDLTLPLVKPVENKPKNEVQGPSWDDFVIEKVLGEGAYGKVYKVHKKLN